MNRVGVIDYGAANIENVVRALRSVGASFSVITRPQEVNSCFRLILPGVGAFPFGMKRLRETGLAERIKVASDQAVPILGICLGMQLLFSTSEEFGHTNGLSLLKGSVTKLPSRSRNEMVPRFGWYKVFPTENYTDSKLSIASGGYYYFAHSYYALPSDNSQSYLSKHGQVNICVGIEEKNTFGVQFHPEKSGLLGHKLLQSFLQLKG